MKPQISPEEHCQRLKALQRTIQEREIDTFVVSSFESIYYLTGAGFEPLERPFFLLVEADGPPLLLVPRLDQEHMAKAYGIEKQNIVTYREYPAPAAEAWPSRLTEILSGKEQIGIEPTVRREITDQLKDCSLRTEPLIEKLRLIKSPAEIEMIKRAASYADFGVKRLLSASYSGAMVAEGFAETRTVSARVIRELDDWDALTNKVLMATWAAPYSAQPHSIPKLEHLLGTGPHVALVLTRVNGYSAECERTYFTSRPDERAQATFAAMMKAREMAFHMIKPGLPCHELDLAVKELLCKEGYPCEHQQLHRTGHGIGLGTHEGPWLAEGSEDRLFENMVISIEPGIYLAGLGGFRHSDTVLVTKDGPELLTHCPTDLHDLIIPSWKPIRRMIGWQIRRKFCLTRRY